MHRYIHVIYIWPHQISKRGVRRPMPLAVSRRHSPLLQDSQDLSTASASDPTSAEAMIVLLQATHRNKLHIYTHIYIYICIHIRNIYIQRRIATHLFEPYKGPCHDYILVGCPHPRPTHQGASYLSNWPAN